MELELASGNWIAEATDADIYNLIDGEEFAILSRTPDHYMQCAAQEEPAGEYILEYQDGSLREHFEAVDRPITLQRVTVAFLKYLRGDTSWQSDFRWEKMNLA